MTEKYSTEEYPFERFNKIWESTVEPEIQKSSLNMGAVIGMLRLYADKLEEIRKTCENTIGVECLIDQLDPQGERREFLDSPELRVLTAVDQALIELVKHEKLTGEQITTVYAKQVEKVTEEFCGSLDVGSLRPLE